MLHLHFSNRFELLTAQLLHSLAQSAAGPFDAEAVVVPSAAVRRSLTLAMADGLDLCAQVQFSYLAPWLWAQMGRVLPGVAAQSPFAPPVLRWRVYAELAPSDWQQAHPRLQGYLHAADAPMRFELAGQVAGLYDQYLTYRPDWLLAWQQGQPVALPRASPQQRADAAWQAALWRRLAAGSEQARLATGTAFVDALQSLAPEQARAAGLPATLHIFALPSMPALHMHWLQHIARLVQVHLYVLNPCQEYWFELIEPRRLSHLTARGRAPEAAHQEVGHRLLATWGRQTQAMIDGLVDRMDSSAPSRSSDDALFQPLPGHSLLARLHNSVLTLQEPAPGDWPLADADRSVEVHLAHSLTRELEVLHDHLLALLARGELQHPSQVLVLTPDLEAAAPLIDAVFGTMPPARALPYTLTGRARSRVNAPARALLAVLAAAGSRFLASEVFALLQQDIVARRFGLDAAALQQLHDGLAAAGLRWGLDAGHRASLQLPASAAQTWADALDRLFLGHALPAEPSPSSPPFNGLLPAADTEGSAALALGALAQFIARLGQLHRAVAQPRPARAWQALLLQAIAQFLQPQADELDDQRELQLALAELFDTLQRSGADGPGAEPLPFPVLQAALRQQLDDPARGGVPTGGITFSAMSSLRSLPFAHVCVIGLNDGAFPGTQRVAEFDLMPLQPRRGDRQRRDDERNLFLDLVLAARRSLYLSYSGRSQRDNAVLPPSVLISELLDLLLPAVAEPPGDAAALARARRRLVVDHPLQPFDLSAFLPEAQARLRSFNAELAAALRSGLRAAALARSEAMPVVTAGAAGAGEAGVDGFEDEADDDVSAQASLPVFFSTPLPEPDPAWRRLSLSQLDGFLRQPCRALLRRRLGVDLARKPLSLQDDEAFVPDARTRQALAAQLLPSLLAGADAHTLPALARAGRDWPPGPLGEARLQQELQALQAFADDVRAHTAAPLLPPCSLEWQWSLDGEDWRLTAPMNQLRPAGALLWRYAPLRAADRLSAWLLHLVLCASQDSVDAPAAAPHTLLLSTDAPLHLPALPPARARALLGELVALVRRGLRAPLHFFPRSAWAWVEAGGDLAAAQRAWRVSPQQPFGESADAAYRLALRGCGDPLDAEFEALAQQVFGPLHHLLASRAEAQATAA